MNRSVLEADQPASSDTASPEVRTGDNPSAIRALLLLVAFLVVSAIVVGRLLAWQVPPNTSSSAGTVPPVNERARGRIVDANGLLLATDSFLWEVYLRPTQLLSSDESARLTTELAKILDRSPEAFRSELSAAPAQYIAAKDATDTQCQAIKELGEPDLAWCSARRQRVYPMDTLGAPLIGFANLDQEGAAGVESSYDAWLRHTADWPDSRLPVSRPEPLPESWKLYLPSPTGRDLVLHMNAALQHMTEKRLNEAVQYYGAESGTIIVMDPRTGGILALANGPSFDPNHYSESPEELWGNPAVRDSYEPGSVFKLVTYAAALDSRKITPETVFEDSGSLTVSSRPVRNAELLAYGEVTAEEALAKSINVVAAEVCLDMGSEVFYRYVRQFGFGRPTEVDLSYESEGMFNSPGNGYWSEYDQAANSFGQGISVTALQMLNAVAAIANGGAVLQPQAVQALVTNGQVYEVPPRMLRQAIRPETAQTMARMMVYSVESSSNPDLVPGYRVAGKTGTAEIPTTEGYTSEETITSFAAFLPAADPQIAVLVKLVKPQRSTWAEYVVVPVFTQVAQDAIQILRIQPDDRMP
jgi:stage V sporulation protein D (sporulation-specific penicillin-binding protein)